MAARSPSSKATRTYAWQQLRMRAFEVYGRHCWMCGAYADTVDHLDPVSTGGAAVPTIDRVRPSCSYHNSSRGSKAVPARGGGAIERSGVLAEACRPTQEISRTTLGAYGLVSPLRASDQPIRAGLLAKEDTHGR